MRKNTKVKIAKTAKKLMELLAGILTIILGLSIALFMIIFIIVEWEILGPFVLIVLILFIGTLLLGLYRILENYITINKEES